MKRIIITAMLATLSMAGVQSVNCETKKVILCPENIKKTIPETDVNKNDYAGPQANEKVIKFLKKVANTKCPKKGAEKNGLTYTYDKTTGEVIRVADTAYTLHVGQLNQCYDAHSKTYKRQITFEGEKGSKIEVATTTFTNLQTIGINDNSSVWVVTPKNDSQNILAFAQPATIRAEGVLDKLKRGCIFSGAVYGALMRCFPKLVRLSLEDSLKTWPGALMEESWVSKLMGNWCYALDAAALGAVVYGCSGLFNHTTTTYELQPTRTI